MATKKEQGLKRIIRRLPLDSPSPNFTSMVMREVEADMKDEVAITPELRSMLIRSGVTAPPIEFAYAVMALVKADHQTVYQPIISKKVWAAVAVLTLFFIGFMFTGQTTTAAQGLTPYAVDFGKRLIALFQDEKSIPSLLVFTCISAALLLSIDYFLEKRKRADRIRSTT